MAARLHYVEPRQRDLARGPHSAAVRLLKTRAERSARHPV